MTAAAKGLTDVAFEDAKDVTEILYRLASIDVGFSLKELEMVVRMEAGSEPVVRASYEDRDGERRVVCGGLEEVAAHLREHGYLIEVVS